MLAPRPRVKVLVKLFQKLACLGRAHKNGAFFLPSFFFAPCISKKKRYYRLTIPMLNNNYKNKGRSLD
jgi:hypothetical protein